MLHKYVLVAMFGYNHVIQSFDFIIVNAVLLCITHDY